MAQLVDLQDLPDLLDLPDPAPQASDPVSEIARADPLDLPCPAQTAIGLGLPPPAVPNCICCFCKAALLQGLSQRAEGKRPGCYCCLGLLPPLRKAQGKQELGSGAADAGGGGRHGAARDGAQAAPPSAAVRAPGAAVASLPPAPRRRCRAMQPMGRGEWGDIAPLSHEW